MGFDYLRFVEKARTDTYVFSLEKLSHKWYIDTQKAQRLPLSFPFDRIQINQTLEGFIAANPGYGFYLIGIPDDRIGKYPTINRLLVKQVLYKPAGREAFSEVERLKSESKALSYKLDYPLIRNFREELIDYCAKSELEAGFLFFSNKELKFALPHYEKALEINPWLVPAYKHLGKLYFELKEYEKSKSSFRKYLQLDTSNDPDRKTLEEFVKAK